MANMRLRETILAVVDNQLRDNNPPCTRRAYERLQKAGYSKKEAKEKLAAVVLEEIYDVMSQNQPFDEERLCSMTTTVLPPSTSRWRTSISLWTSAEWRPVVGSSRI